MYEPPGPGRTQTRMAPGEAWLLAGFLLLFGGLLVGEIVRDFRPVKLSILFFVVAWCGLTVLHEAAHAVVARWFGWRVARIGLGFGRRIKRFRVGGIPVELRMVPISGFVVPVPTTLRHARLANAVIHFAGPGVELALAGAIVALVGWDPLLTPTESVGIIAAQAVALAALAGAVLNLLPFSRGEGEKSDGLGILMSPFLPPAWFEAQMVMPCVLAAEERLEAGDAAGALRLLESAQPEHPDVLLLHLLAARCLVRLGRRGEALMRVQGLLRRADPPPRWRERVEQALADLRQA